MAILPFQITKLPDLSLNKYQSLSDTGVDGLLSRHESFLRQWHGICAACGCSFHLLYVYDPARELGQRLQLYFILQGEAESLQMTKPLLQSSPLSDFYAFEDAKLPGVQFAAGGTMLKKERLANIYNPLNGQMTSVHYVPEWEMNDGARLYDLFRMMQNVGENGQPAGACAFRVDFYPDTAVAEVRKAFEPVQKQLNGDNDIKLLRETDSVSRDSYARDISREYEKWLTTIETSPVFRVNIYGFAATQFGTKVILNAAGAESIQKGDFATAPIRCDADGGLTATSRMTETAESYCFYPKDAALKSWATTYSLADAVPFFRFPVLYDGETIELPKETAPAQGQEGLYIGKDTNGYPVRFPLKDLPRHAFFTGMPGAGKTNTMLHLATELKKYGIPFLALEPAKKEYRALLADEHMKDVYLFSPHLQSRFPLYMNPMQFPRGARLSEHINALLEVFEGTFTLEGPTYKFLSSAIQKSYCDLGWDIEDTYDAESEMDFPSLQDVFNNLEQEINASSYDSELKGNVIAFLQVRLGGLMERDAGELFNVHISTIPPEKWLESSAIVELEVLGEQAKNFFVLMVCHYILETLRVNPNGGVFQDGTKMPVRHVVFIEEAHNIIASSSQQDGTDTVNPKISATAYIVKMLAEVRALREAIIIADQLPTALTTEVTKNTGLKLVHRLAAKDDREEIGTAISASALQLEQMASFTVGKALIHHEKTMKPFAVQVAEWKNPAENLDVSDDMVLYPHVCGNAVMENVLETAIQAWNDKYCYPFYQRIAAHLEQGMELDHADPAKAVLYKTERLELKRDCENLEKKWERLRALWLDNTDVNPVLREEWDAVAREIALLKESIQSWPQLG